MEYGWVITKDHIADSKAPLKTNCNAVGISGPYGCPFDDDHITARGRKFKMFDDDGELYYEGYMLGENEFGPLEDFGMPNAGCTRIEYEEENK